MAPPRKVLPSSGLKESETQFCLRKPDGEPLLRQEIQYDLLQYIFSDRIVDFTAPVDQNAPHSAPVRLHFDQLYLEAILSSKLSVPLRNNLISNPEFALNFSCLALLVNIGRMNTTLSFHVNSKSPARTYHSIPSLQQEEQSKTFQDTTRIKAILRACHLDWEGATQPDTLSAIATKSADSQLRGPPTTVVAAISNLFGVEAHWVNAKYFAPGVIVHDLFYPSSLSVESRGQAFLTLVHHILENKTFINDFTNLDQKSPNFPYSPRFIDLAPNDGSSTDVDTPDELKFGMEMRRTRVMTMQPLQASDTKQSSRPSVSGGAGSDNGSVPNAYGTKRRRVRLLGESYARSMSVNPPPNTLVKRKSEDYSRTIIATTSTLPYVWDSIKRDTLISRDPDYDSEEDDWPLDLLLQRSLLTVSDPATGIRRSIREIMDNAEREESIGGIAETEQSRS